MNYFEKTMNKVVQRMKVEAAPDLDLDEAAFLDRKSHSNRKKTQQFAMQAWRSAKS